MPGLIRNILIANEKEFNKNPVTLFVCICMCISVKTVNKLSCDVRMNEMLIGSSCINKLQNIPYDNG